MDFEKTSITFYGIVIQEPVTVLTNLFISIVCFYAFLKLKPTNRIVTLLKYYFLTMALATLYSAIFGHALLYYISFGWKAPGWIMSMCSVALLERASITHAQPFLPKKIGSLFTALNSIELISLIAIVLTTFKFIFVEVHAAYGLLVIVFSFELFIFMRTKAESSKLFLLAVAISSIAGFVHLTQFSIHPWFNHSDLSHVIIAISAYVFLCGGQKLDGEASAHSNETLKAKSDNKPSRILYTQ